MSTQLHFWQGEFIDDAEAAERLAQLPDLVARTLAEPLSTETVLVACDTLSRALHQPHGEVHARLMDHLTGTADGPERAEATALLAELADALARPALERKLRRELGGPRPERFTRPDARETIYEAWAPVGLLVHIAPGNAAGVAPLSVVEGLLAGNVNVLKTSSGDTALPQHLLAELAAADPTGALGRRIVALRFPSSRQDLMRAMCAPADAVAVWGGEAAVEGVAALLPPGCRLVEWGHKISFAYLTRETWTDRTALTALATDVCRVEQQACSSPQVVYLDLDVETHSDADDGADARGELFAFAEQFAAVLDEVSAKTPGPWSATDDGTEESDGTGGTDLTAAAEQAELTTTELVARAEQHLGLTKVIAAADGSWRVFADTRPALTASPLHRTIWIKPLPRQEIVATLRPMRRYLQTAAVGGSRADLAQLSRTLITAGVQRITPLGAMLDSYHGEPHDGVYALQRYSRRVDVQTTGTAFTTVPCLDDLIAPAAPPATPTGPLMDKAAAQAQLRSLAPEHAQLYFRSGGTTGTPALSVFTCDDYDTQMRAAAHGLLAAGFDPAHDRAANLFFCGEMYGSFISFFSILERLGATQIPMAAGPDHEAIAEALVTDRVDTLFGMPSYLWQLLHSQSERLRAYGGIRKIYYGGEHFTAEQRRILTDTFGVEVIRSAAYGSTDLGPLGYQCAQAQGTVHHVLTDLHTLEILDPREDRPVAPGQPGRLVFTTRTRTGQHLERYEIGDLGRAVDGVCPCGSHTPRIELLGRYGDVFRMGTYHFNYRRFTGIAEEHLDYRGELQLVLTSSADREHLTVRLDEHYAPDPDTARTALLAHIPELGSAVGPEALLTCTVETVPGAGFERTPTSGKLRTVIDRRKPTA
ncbi:MULTISPECIES: acyl-CoA reductase [unclassified Streptomyces]|uniref:acyl-CoA reductase n=1 Tax=unclassified Streptomyces TaxID=2593676 RepID=UPI00035C9E6E|nr:MULTISPECIES: acyl-CoA reductase [unclassified Streptomyces]MYT31360.1 AMP-binding protein [Streptomyces sp. SID8354]